MDNNVDPFIFAKAIADGAKIAGISARKAAEITRLVKAGDLFGAGLVVSGALGRPLKAI